MEVCKSCALLHLQLTNFRAYPGKGEHPRLEDLIRSLGRLSEIRNRYKTCPFCRLVFAFFRSGPLEQLNCITDSSSIIVFANWINALGAHRAERSRSPSNCILLWAESPLIASNRYKIVVRAVSDLLPTQPHFGR
jgi:hypothetical protein